MGPSSLLDSSQSPEIAQFEAQAQRGNFDRFTLIWTRKPGQRAPTVRFI
jgi:hypothetical protein